MSAMAKKAASVKKTESVDKVELYDRLIAARKEVERKGDANPYTAVNGNMFTILLGSQKLGFGCRRASGRSF